MITTEQRLFMERAAREMRAEALQRKLTVEITESVETFELYVQIPNTQAGVKVRLLPFYARYKQGDREVFAVMRSAILSALFEPASELEWPAIEGKLRLKIEGEQAPLIPADIQAGGVYPLVRPVCAGLKASLVIDYPDRVLRVTNEHLNKIGVGEERAWRQGQRNMRELPPVTMKHVREQVWCCDDTDGYAASMLLSERHMEQIREQCALRGPLIVGVPHRDLLLVAPLSHIESAGIVGYAIRRFGATAPYKVSPAQAYEWSKGVVRPLRLGAN